MTRPYPRSDRDPAQLHDNTERPLSILHVSGDYPDTIDPFKTTVIKTLVDLARAEFRHEVFSLNRKSPTATTLIGQMLRRGGRPQIMLEAEPFADGTAISYAAPGRGIFHATLLRQLGDKLAERIAISGEPDLIVGHKLTIEGIVVHRMAQRLNVPYAVSIQGDTDTKILAMRPDLAGELGRVFHGAAMVFPFTPWAMRKVEAKLGKRQGPSILLPCPTDLDQPLAPSVTGSKELLCVFHLRNFKRKNLKGLAEAMRMLAKSDPAISLTIIGGGSEADIARCKSILAGIENVSLAGPMSHEALRQRFNAANAFVMPSLRESFGLVFVEALFSGLPIIYPAGTAVDGFFDDAAFALKVDAHSASDIAEAIRGLIRRERDAKQALAEWQSSAEAGRFDRQAIGRDFVSGLRIACENRTPSLAGPEQRRED